MASASAVKELRERTGAGFMECKNALVENNNDLDAAVEFLKQRGLAKAGKKAGRAANEGRIHSYIHGNGKLGVMVEVNCETDFVANTDEYQAFVNDIAMHVAAASPLYLNADEIPDADKERERETFRAQALESGKPEQVVDKIVDGKLKKHFEEVCLMNQKFVKDPDKTITELLTEQIAKLGENIAIRRFVRFQLGESTA